MPSGEWVEISTSVWVGDNPEVQKALVTTGRQGIIVLTLWLVVHLSFLKNVYKVDNQPVGHGTYLQGAP